MNSFANFVVRHRKSILAVFILLIIISLILIPQVKTNFELSKYLPEGMPSKNGISLTEKEFGLPGSAKIMIPNITIPEAKIIKDKIMSVAGVDTVLWLDDAANIYEPTEFINKDFLDEYYKENNALFDVYFKEDDSSLNTSNAIEEIKDIIGDNGYLAGSAIETKSVREITQSQISKITMFAIPLVFIILLFATSSWFEPILFMTVIGISIVINMGTNIFLGEVSFLTKSMTTALQLAISMDYSIFLLHRFADERSNGLGVEEAMRNAVRKSLSSILASAMTTMAGFLALVLMRFKIGEDMGLVFAKGIILSLISVIFLLPALTIIFDKLIEKTHHRTFIPSFKGFAKLITKHSYITIVIVLIALVPAYLAQSSNQFVYGASAVSSSEGSKVMLDREQIEAVFGKDNPVVLLIPKGNSIKEGMLTDELKATTAVKDVKSLVTLAPKDIPKSFLPKALLDNFESENYSRIIITLNTEEESDVAFTALEQIKNIADRYYEDSFSMTGGTAVADDIRAVVGIDYKLINLLSILAVGLIILLTFRSITLPVLLVTAIEAAIVINMAIPYFTGISMAFIGYLIISAIQLGATIDYAILLTNRYIEYRNMYTKKEAAINAIADTGGSIATSAGILCISGFIIGQISSISTISQMGTLIGRGALLSCIIVFTLLPQLLVLFDNLIQKTSIGLKFDK